MVQAVLKNSLTIYNVVNSSLLKGVRIYACMHIYNLLYHMYVNPPPCGVHYSGDACMQTFKCIMRKLKACTGSW